MEHINGRELMDYLRMVRVFSETEWKTMKDIEISNDPLMEKEFSFLEGLACK